MNTVRKIAWIGLGNMGVPMVEHLAEGSEQVVAYNRSPRPQTSLGNATVSQDIAEVVDDADVVFVMVSDGAAVRDVLFGQLDVAGRVNSGTLIVNMSTIGVEETKDLARQVEERELFFMDAPVSGSVQPAKDATLVVLAGGTKEHFTTMEPLLLRMGKNVFHLGEVGSGAAMKLLMNTFLGLMMETSGECMALADKTGLTRESFLEVLSTTGMWAPILHLKLGPWTKRDFTPAFALKHMTKDLQLASNFAQEQSVSMPALMSAMAMFMAAREEGYGEQDMAAVSEYIGELSKI